MNGFLLENQPDAIKQFVISQGECGFEGDLPKLSSSLPCR